MKIDSQINQKHTWTFNKSELIDMMLEAYSKKSGVVLKDVDKKNCRLIANNKETHHVELVFTKDKNRGEDYNGA